MTLKLSTTLLAASIFAAAAASPHPSTAVATEYHYYLSDGTEIPLTNQSLPITIDGVPVGVIELPLLDTSAAGESVTHDLSTGHHFGHKDWFINADNMWEYQEGYEDRLQSRQSSSPDHEPRSTVKAAILINDLEDEVDFELSSGIDYIQESAYIHSVTGANAPFYLIQWDVSGISWVNLWSSDDVTQRPYLTVGSAHSRIDNTSFYAFGIQPQ